MILVRPHALETSSFLQIAAYADNEAARPELARGSASWDWDRLIAFAVVENSITVLRDCVARFPGLHAPPEHRMRIARLSRIWDFKLALLERRLEGSLAALSSAGIGVILLKGAALGLTTYRSFGARPMADLDMLVHPDEARGAHSVMRQNGWVVDTGGHPSDAWDDHHHLPPLRDARGSGLRVEIHLAPLPPGNPFRMDFEDIRATSERFVLGKVDVRIPDIHLHAVHASIHFAWCHRFESGAVNAFRDLATLEQCGRFDWTRFVDAARRAGAERPCYWTVRLARALAGVNVPDEVLTCLRPNTNETALSLLEEHFSQLALRLGGQCPSATIRNRLWAYALQSRLSATDEIVRWHPEARIDRQLVARGARRIASHLRRAGDWSSYLSDMIAAATRGSGRDEIPILLG